jgi:hypothetical protein
VIHHVHPGERASDQIRIAYISGNQLHFIAEIAGPGCIRPVDLG